MSPSDTFIAGSTRAPRNQWYVAAFTHEVGDKPLARQLLGDAVVLFRGEDGAAVALADRCAHRAAALSCGKVVGNHLQCFYHGMQYDRSGRCVRVPSQPEIPAAMKVRSYPVVETSCWLWIWMGDPLRADASLIPDHGLFGLADPALYVDTFFRMEINGNYQLLHENLLDVSHISFLHEGSFDTGLICRTDPRVEVDGSRILIEREVQETLTGAYAFTFEFAEGTRVRRLLRSQSWVPGLNVVTNMFWDLDRPQDGMRFIHAVFPITPKTDGACHYFTATAKNYGMPRMPEEIKARVWDVFLTDKAAIESVQSAYDALGAHAPDTSVKADQAALRYRRMVGEALAREASTP